MSHRWWLVATCAGVAVGELMPEGTCGLGSMGCAADRVAGVAGVAKTITTRGTIKHY
ncbi:MAG: hypothetical protein H0V96_05060, partial [Acidimicrobiia bacterium]|nr:hypothetical protein [Acidimicrobiia bacterium]